VRKVLVYKSDWLPHSETFIRDQVLAYERWRPIPLGLFKVSQLDLQGLEVLELRPKRTLGERVVWKLASLRYSIPRAAVRAVASEGADLLHAHFGTDAVGIWALAKALDLPMIVSLHGYDINIHRWWWETGREGWLMRRYPAMLDRMAQAPRVHFVVASNASRERAIEQGIPADKITICRYGIDLRRFAAAGPPIIARPRRVVFVGRLVEKKGCEFLIRAFARVQGAVEDASLVIVGDGPLRGTLETLANELGARAQFLGVRSSDEVRDELQRSRLLCLPSITAVNGDAEGFGLTIVEAQAMGLPVLTSARGGAEEGIVDGTTGIAFRERDVDALTAGLRELLTDDAKVASMSIAAIAHVRANFEIRASVRRLEDAYDTFLASLNGGNGRTP
jgi:glycosyltransferase involved in cell wall biosynthesis